MTVLQRVVMVPAGNRGHVPLRLSMPVLVRLSMPVPTPASPDLDPVTMSVCTSQGAREASFHLPCCCCCCAVSKENELEEEEEEIGYRRPCPDVRRPLLCFGRPVLLGFGFDSGSGFLFAPLRAPTCRDYWHQMTP